MKASDKETASNETAGLCTATFNLQKVLICPSGKPDKFFINGNLYRII